MKSAKDPEAIEAYLATLRTTENTRALFRRYGIHYRWLAMFANMLATVATLLTGTIINVAIPDIMGTYGIGYDKVQLLSTLYLAAGTVTMLTTSWLVSTFGTRATVVGSMLLFLVGSLWGGLAPDENHMIFARILQGASSGIITPIGMSQIFQTFPLGRQGFAMGVSSIGAILAPALGPTIGGLLVDTLNWRYVFFLGVPFSLVCVPLAMLFLPPREASAPSTRLDGWGLATLSLGLSALLLALGNGEKIGWESNEIVGLLLFAAATLGFFLYWQTRVATPLLNLRVFGYRQFTVAAIVSFAFGAGLYGSTYLVPLFLQIVQGATPTTAGLTLMPAGLALAAVFPYAGRLADMMSHRRLVVIGIIVFGGSFALMTAADHDTSFWTYAWWLVLGRIGIGLVMPALSIASMRGLPMEILHQASGAMSFLRQLGGAFGVNLLSFCLDRRTQFHRENLTATQTSENDVTSSFLQGVVEQLHSASLSASEQWGMAYSQLAQSIHIQANMLGFRDSFWISAGLFCLTLIPAWLIGRGAQPANPPRP